MKITKEQVLENLEDVKKYIQEAENKKEEKVIGIAIKSRFTGSIIFQSTKTTYKEAIEEKGNANLRDADLRGANLCYANLSGADLRDADLCYADLCYANLSGANLRDADLRDANLCDANLSGANLRDADLRGANLSGANLRDADLCYANLSGANLRDADIRDADLRDAELQNVKFYGKTSYPKELTNKQLPDFLKALGFIIKD